MHVDSIDYETHCKTLASCLGVLKEWSDNNPDHIPLILRVELKLETMIETLERGDQTAAQTVLTEVEEANGVRPGNKYWMSQVWLVQIFARHCGVVAFLALLAIASALHHTHLRHGINSGCFPTCSQKSNVCF